MTKISTRQLLFFLACVAPVGKIVLMPNQLVRFAQNDLLIPTLLNYLLQAALIFVVLLIARSNQTFYELLENTFGKIVAKILVCIFALFLFFAALYPIFEQREFVQSTFYDTLPDVLLYFPFFLFSAYLCLKPLSAIGRIWDLLAPFAIIGYLGILILSVGQADFQAILPVGASGAKGIFGGMAYTLSWFFDSAIVLMLMGRFRYEKGLALKGAISYLLGGLAVLLFLATFYGVFSSIAIRQTFAFAKISKFFSGITVLGRIDYLFIYTLALVYAFYCALPLQAGAECVKEAFGGGKVLSLLVAVGVNGVILALIYFFKFSTHTVGDVITITLFWIFIIFCVGVPLAALLLRRKKREKNS